MELLAPLRRKLKNTVLQFTETQVKVREATSNDPCNPPIGLLIELADLSLRQNDQLEIMQLIWKRLNERYGFLHDWITLFYFIYFALSSFYSGAQWRHCYKSLLVLEYLFKMGDPKVLEQCKQHVRSLQTLSTFQHVDETGTSFFYSIYKRTVVL